MIYLNEGEHHLYHGSRPKRSLEGPQICTRAGQLQPTIIQGKDFVAVRQQFTYRMAAPGKKTGSVWTQLLVFPVGKRYFISMDKIEAVNFSEAMFLRIDMPGHVRHNKGDTFSEIYLSYRGRIPAAKFLPTFRPTPSSIIAGTATPCRSGSFAATGFVTRPRGRTGPGWWA